MTASVRDSLLTLTGLQKVTLTADDKIVKENPNIYIDFNAIGKGYAVDVLVELLHDQFRYENILVEIGGELRAVGINSIKIIRASIKLVPKDSIILENFIVSS